MAVNDLVSIFADETVRALWRYWSVHAPDRWWAAYNCDTLAYAHNDPELVRLIKWRLGDPRLQRFK